VTVAAISERKGYLEKQGCRTDGRIVRVRLSREGRKVDAYTCSTIRIWWGHEAEFTPRAGLLLRTIVSSMIFSKLCWRKP
jgi:DNA-binding MarR family transcriptional regulator